MTPGWTNVRNQLAESRNEPAPRGLASLNWPVVIVLGIVSIAVWCIAVAVLRVAL